jgi:hypothetical protein
VAKSKQRLVSPTNEKRTVAPRRRPNAELRTREHLTEREVERLIEAAKANRHGQGTGYVRRSYVTFAGIRWTSIGPSSTSVESNRAHLQRTP